MDPCEAGKVISRLKKRGPASPILRYMLKKNKERECDIPLVFGVKQFYTRESKNQKPASAFIKNLLK
jgi:hypothetical protein